MFGFFKIPPPTLHLTADLFFSYLSVLMYFKPPFISIRCVFPKFPLFMCHSVMPDPTIAPSPSRNQIQTPQIFTTQLLVLTQVPPNSPFSALLPLLTPPPPLPSLYPHPSLQPSPLHPTGCPSVEP